jgi:hypothetical protein
VSFTATRRPTSLSYPHPRRHIWWAPLGLLVLKLPDSANLGHHLTSGCYAAAATLGTVTALGACASCAARPAGPVRGHIGLVACYSYGPSSVWTVVRHVNHDNFEG